MGKILIFFVILGIVAVLVQTIGKVLYFLLIYIVPPVLGLFFIYKLIQFIHHFINPEAKQKYEIKKALQIAEYKENKVQREEEARRKRIDEVTRKKEKEKRIKNAEIKKENDHKRHRDADKQSKTYTYKIGRHGNESLAIRYGIANQQQKVNEYWYHAKGGERKRNPERDVVHHEPTTTIQLQKTKRIGEDLYEVLLTDYRNRKAKAIIEVGTEYVKTFYPLKENWFDIHADLEETLKGNGSFTLKELATFHVQKTIGI